MALKIVELVSIVLTALTLGVFWGPWLALSRSMASFGEETFLAIVHRMDRNMGTFMTVLMPLTLASVVPVLILSFGQWQTFVLSLLGLLAFVVSLIVTMVVEVPIVAQIRGWTLSTMPGEWQRLRDRWVSFHLVRILAGFLGFVLLLSAALF